MLLFPFFVQADLKSAVESCENLQIRQIRSLPYVDCKSTAATACVTSLCLADFQSAIGIKLFIGSGDPNMMPRGITNPPKHTFS